MARSSLVGLLGLALSFGCAFAGCFTPVTPPPGSSAPSLSLVAASWSGSALPIVIASVHNGASLTPADLRFDVKDAHEVQYFLGPAGKGADVNGTRVAVVYGDNAGPGKVTAGDGIVITLNSSAPETFGNGTLEVSANATVIAHLKLPAPPSQSSQRQISLSAGSWSNGNVTLSITSTFNAGSLTPTDLIFIVLDSSGTVFYSAGANHPRTSGAVTVNVFFNDFTDPGNVSSGDSIRLSITPSTSMALAGGVLSVAVGTQEIGRATLP